MVILYLPDYLYKKFYIFRLVITNNVRMSYAFVNNYLFKKACKATT